MRTLAENLKEYRLCNDFTQEEVARCLGVTPQSVSKWERGETYPDIAFLPALANLFSTSIDALMGMDTIRAADTRWNIHRTATAFAREGSYAAAEQVYRDALRTYPNKPGMLLGLAGVLALQDRTEEAISLIERGLPLSENEQQKATMRAVLCLLYERAGEPERARNLAANLPHTRESREEILAQLSRSHDEADIQKGIRLLLLGE